MKRTFKVTMEVPAGATAEDCEIGCVGTCELLAPHSEATPVGALDKRKVGLAWARAREMTVEQWASIYGGDISSVSAPHSGEAGGVVAEPVRVIPQGVMGIPPNPPGSGSSTVGPGILSNAAVLHGSGVGGAADKPVHNPWKESLQNCITGDNYLRAQEWQDLIDELDALYAAQPQPAISREIRDLLSTIRYLVGAPSAGDTDTPMNHYHAIAKALGNWPSNPEQAAKRIDALLAKWPTNLAAQPQAAPSELSDAQILALWKPAKSTMLCGSEAIQFARGVIAASKGETK
jgi:hypothetical protein